MCGFVGILIDQKGVARQCAVASSTIVQKCLPKLRRRGPDAEGVFADENIALGHNRLAIQDLSKMVISHLFRVLVRRSSLSMVKFIISRNCEKNFCNLVANLSPSLTLRS